MRSLLDEQQSGSIQQCLHSLFEERAFLDPEAPAVIYGSESVSFSELDRRSNQFAHRLMDHSVKRETRVAVCMENSVELLEVLLAILKVGAAYVPLDPAYPLERLKYIVRDSSAEFLVADKAHRDRILDVSSETQGLSPDRQQSSAYPQCRIPDWARQGTPQNLAYVIYTSGSTGIPKGVAIEHGSVVNLVTWMTKHCQIGPGDRCLQKAPISFDASVIEIFMPLLSGATLVAARPGGHADATYLAELIREHKITFAQFVPSTLAAFLREPLSLGCSSLRYVHCGGEALTPSLAQEFSRTFTGCSLQNVYGPTEATVDATIWTVTDISLQQSVPIGLPISGIETYVLDEHLQPVEAGAEGELYLGGLSLARGYIARSAMTAASFVANPFASLPGSRMYRTGDLVKRSSKDGPITYLGRTDTQVKIRGHRVELQEVAARLAAQEGIKEVAVITDQNASGEQRLVAYYTPEPDGQNPPTPYLLYQHLLSVLPEYMVPRIYVQLQTLPTTPNGKLERKQLPKPDARSFVRGTASGLSRKH